MTMNSPFNSDEKRAVTLLADAYAELMVFQKTGRGFGLEKKLLCLVNLQKETGVTLCSDGEIGLLSQLIAKKTEETARAIRRSKMVDVTAFGGA